MRKVVAGCMFNGIELDNGSDWDAIQLNTQLTTAPTTALKNTSCWSFGDNLTGLGFSLAAGFSDSSTARPD